MKRRRLMGPAYRTNQLPSEELYGACLLEGIFAFYMYVDLHKNCFIGKTNWSFGHERKNM